MNIETTVTVANHIDDIARRLKSELRAVVQKTVADVEAEAKQRAPVDTGALRNSIQGAMTGELEGVVAVGMDYAGYVEYGTTRAPAQPYLHPSADAARPGFEAAVAERLRQSGG